VKNPSPQEKATITEKGRGCTVPFISIRGHSGRQGKGKGSLGPKRREKKGNVRAVVEQVWGGRGISPRGGTFSGEKKGLGTAAGP